MVILLPIPTEERPSASFIKELIQRQNITVISILIPSITTAQTLNIQEFANFTYQYGINLSQVEDKFRLREIVLLKTPHMIHGNVVNFGLISIWNCPESTLSIDAIRIPYEGKTDSRNNPLGKNPGNIWAFSGKLADRTKNTQIKLFTLKDPITYAKGLIEEEVIIRIIKGHSQPQDRIYIWNALDETEKLERLCQSLQRQYQSIPSGKSEPIQQIPIQTQPLPIITSGGLTPLGKTTSQPRAIFYHTDCRHGLTTLSLEPIDDVITSPPYNIGYRPFNVPKPDQKTGELIAPEREGYQDELPQAQYNELIRETMALIDQKLNPKSADIFFNIKNNYMGGECNPPFWILQLIPSSWNFTDILIWRYDISFDPAVNKYKPYYEWIFRFTKGTIFFHPNHKYLQDYYIPILKGNSRERRNLVHPAIYPKELVKICLKESNHQGLVLDPFLGSGTTIAAAWESNRPSIGFELNARYLTDIELRLQSAQKNLK